MPNSDVVWFRPLTSRRTRGTNALPFCVIVNAPGRDGTGSGEQLDEIASFKIALWGSETAETHAALGEAYRQAQDPIAARAEAERALALDPASPDAKALLARLDAR